MATASQAPPPQATVQVDIIIVGLSFRLRLWVTRDRTVRDVVGIARGAALERLASFHGISQQPNFPPDTLPAYLLSDPVSLDRSVGSFNVTLFGIQFSEDTRLCAILINRAEAMIQLENTHSQQMAAITNLLGQQTTIREQLEQRTIVLEAEIVKLKKKVANLAARLASLRSDNDQLEDKAIELQRQLDERDRAITDLDRKLAKEKAERTAEMAHNFKVTAQLNQLRLRYLLDSAHDKLMRLLPNEIDESPDNTRRRSYRAQDTDRISRDLAGKCELDSEDIKIVISDESGVRQAGNIAAHSATKADIQEAVRGKPLGTKQRYHLERVYEFVYGEKV